MAIRKQITNGRDLSQIDPFLIRLFKEHNVYNENLLWDVQKLINIKEEEKCNFIRTVRRKLNGEKKL
jgi:hypothetical protein